MEFGSGGEIGADRIRVEALGQPGQRRFRMLVVIRGRTTIIWMEKQQLQALGLALEQMLGQLPDTGPRLSEPAAVEFDLDTRRQFRVGRMELGYDETTDRIVIVAHDINQEDDEDDEEEEAPTEEPPPAFVCAVTRDQAHEISADAAAVVAAGRPRCSMCGAPMGPGPHACPQQNGHFPHRLDETESEDR